MQHCVAGPTNHIFTSFSDIANFEKSKGLKCQFDNADVTNAVNDVMLHHPSLREAGRKRNVIFCTQSRYVKQANTEGKDFTTVKKTIKTRHVSECF